MVLQEASPHLRRRSLRDLRVTLGPQDNPEEQEHQVQLQLEVGATQCLEWGIGRHPAVSQALGF
jgi:hypothetical protein